MQTLSRVRIRSEEEVAAMEAQQQQMADARGARRCNSSIAETSGFGAAPADADAAEQAGAQAGTAGRNRHAGDARRSQDRPQRTLPVRQRKKIQTLPRRVELGAADTHQTAAPSAFVCRAKRREEDVCRYIDER